MERVIAYIDGFNLYYGLRSKGWKRYYWLNVQRAMQLLLRDTQVLVYTKYFTSIVDRPPDKNARQRAYLEALGTLRNFSIEYGHYLHNEVTCRQCGSTYTTHHEKMTDVNMAVEMLTDAYLDRFDTAFLVTGDSDAVGVVRRMRELTPGKRVLAVFPPDRRSFALQAACHAWIPLGRGVISKSVFPDTVRTRDGYALHRPHEWR